MDLVQIIRQKQLGPKVSISAMTNTHTKVEIRVALLAHETCQLSFGGSPFKPQLPDVLSKTMDILMMFVLMISVLIIAVSIIDVST